MQNANVLATRTMISELKSSAHLMTLETGLFCLSQRAPSGGQDGLPGVRVSLPPDADAREGGVRIVGFREDGWLSAQGDALLVRVERGPAQVLVTIYQTPQGGEPPKLQVLRLGDHGAARPSSPPALSAVPRQVAARPLEVGAHVQAKGDVSVALGEWIGDRASGRWIEGFAVAPASVIAVEDIEYQALLGRGWLSPWTEGGQFCGSRGMALPILGLRVRLRGAAAGAYDCLYAASFIDGTQAGPSANGQPCEAASLAPLESFQITLQPRTQGGDHATQHRSPFSRH